MENLREDINVHMWKKGGYIQDKENHFFVFPDIGGKEYIIPDMGGSIFSETRTSERVLHN